MCDEKLGEGRVVLAYASGGREVGHGGGERVGRRYPRIEHGNILIGNPGLLCCGGCIGGRRGAGSVFKGIDVTVDVGFLFAGGISGASGWGSRWTSRRVNAEKWSGIFG